MAHFPEAEMFQRMQARELLVILSKLLLKVEGGREVTSDCQASERELRVCPKTGC